MEEDKKVEELINKLDYLKEKDIEDIKKAVSFIIKKHEGQYRKSGEPYYYHPIEAAKILAGLHLDKISIISALLHDVVEDTDTTLEDIQKEFGEQVAHIVDGVTKIGKYHFSSQEIAKAENFRKMIISMSDDIRVLLVKLADRLHNIRTLEHLKPEKQKRIAKETLEIYAPLAARLGLWKIKSELEDTSFKYLDPVNYKKVTTFIAESKEKQEAYLREKIVPQLKQELEKNNIKAKIQYRSKHIYSVYEKTIRKNLSLSDVYDLYGIRIIVDTIKDCYLVLGIIHSIWKPVPGKFKDYISLPKSNFYQALHTTIVAPEGKFVEIQIKTEEMHKVSEEGIAAHWRYKGGSELTEKDIQSLQWLRKILEVVKENSDSSELISTVKNDLVNDEVFVFTPKGDLISLPVGATPVDFAYAIHTQVGHRCSGAKVNGVLVPLDTKLRSGDVVEIITAKQPKPNRNWLNFVVSSKAKSNIKSYFAKKDRETLIKFGKKLFNKFLKKVQKDVNSLTEEEKERLLKKFNYKTFDDLLYAIGNGQLSPSKIMRFCKLKETKQSEKQEVETKTNKAFIEVDGINNLLSNLAKCCCPVPGDEIVGVILKGKGISIHSKECPNAKYIIENEPERIVDCIWKPADSEKRTYPVSLRILSEDTPGLLADVAKIVASYNSNIIEVKAKSNKYGKAITNLKVSVKDKDHLNQIVSSLKKVKNVKEVERAVVSK